MGSIHGGRVLGDTLVSYSHSVHSLDSLQNILQLPPTLFSPFNSDNKIFLTMSADLHEVFNFVPELTTCGLFYTAPPR